MSAILKNEKRLLGKSALITIASRRHHHELKKKSPGIEPNYDARTLDLDDEDE